MVIQVLLFFWLKTRARWKETQAHEVSGPDGQALPVSIGLDFVKPKDNSSVSE